MVAQVPGDDFLQKGGLSNLSGQVFQQKLYDPTVPYAEQVEAIAGGFQVRNDRILLQDENGPYVFGAPGEYLSPDVIDSSKTLPTLPIAYTRLSDPNDPDVKNYQDAIIAQEKLDQLTAEYEAYVAIHGEPVHDTNAGPGLRGAFADNAIGGTPAQDAASPDTQPGPNGGPRNQEPA